MTTNTEELKPCAHCGMKPPSDLDDTLYPSGTFWRALTEEGIEGLRHYFGRSQAKPGDGQCWTMHCTENMGGCGVQVSGDSRDEAISRWNRRPTAQASSGGDDTPDAHQYRYIGDRDQTWRRCNKYAYDALQLDETVETRCLYTAPQVAQPSAESIEQAARIVENIEIDCKVHTYVPSSAECELDEAARAIRKLKTAPPTIDQSQWQIVPKKMTPMMIASWSNNSGPDAQWKASLSAAPKPPAMTADQSQGAIPELHNILNVDTEGDFSVRLSFASCRSAGAFKIAIDAAIATRESGEPS